MAKPPNAMVAAVGNVRHRLAEAADLLGFLRHFLCRLQQAVRLTADASHDQQQHQTYGAYREAIIREGIERPGIVLAEVAHQEPGAG